MATRDAVQALTEFHQRYQGIHLQSTSATVTTYDGDLYNVTGSTTDPKIDNKSWKRLLTDNGINANCYVTAPLPGQRGTSHPGFNVGGHVTSDSDGEVETGETCYLMPMCFWHNSTARDGTAFSHPAASNVLELSGYMQPEPAATFIARMPGAEPYALVGVEGEELVAQKIGAAEVQALRAGVKLMSGGKATPDYYLLFRQIEEDGVTRYVIEEAKLS